MATQRDFPGAAVNVVALRWTSRLAHRRIQRALLALVFLAGIQAATPRLLMAQTTDSRPRGHRVMGGGRRRHRLRRPCGAGARRGAGRVARRPMGQRRRDGRFGLAAPHRRVRARPSQLRRDRRSPHDGYLRLHRIGRGSRHPLWDQQFEAQQVRVLTAAGPVAGVVARSNGHFAPQHAARNHARDR